MSRINKLMNCGLRALTNERYLLIRIKTPYTAGLELIMNPPVNILDKIEYYKNNYTEDLKLKSNQDIEIVDFMEYDIETHQIYYLEGDVNEKYIY